MQQQYIQALSGEGWRGAKLVGCSSGHWICLEPEFRYPEPGRSLAGLCWLLHKPPSRFSDLLGIHKSSGGAVLLAQQSALPSIPKSGLTTLCKDWEIWDWVLDWDRRLHVDPSEHDVITGERRDKEILLRRCDCLSDASYHVLFRSCCCEKLNLTRSQCHKQHKQLGNRKYLHFQRKGASLTPLCAYRIVPSPNSMTATILNDSPRPVKVIIWH